MSTPSISLEHIAEKVRRRRPIRNLNGELIALDSQQLCILRHMCQDGMVHKQISQATGIALREISNSLGHALRITGCKTHAQLGAWAAKVGLV